VATRPGRLDTTSPGHLVATPPGPPWSPRHRGRLVAAPPGPPCRRATRAATPLSVMPANAGIQVALREKSRLRPLYIPHASEGMSHAIPGGPDPAVRHECLATSATPPSRPEDEPRHHAASFAGQHVVGACGGG